MVKAAPARRMLLLNEVNHHGFLAMRMGHLHFGVPVRSVREVTVPQKMNAVGRAPPFIRGVMNLRGQVVALIDAGLRMGLAPVSLDTGRLVILKIGSELPADLCNALGLLAFEDKLGLLVDAVLDVVDVGANSLSEPPANLTGPGSQYVFGMYRFQSSIVGVIDPYELTELDSAGLAETERSRVVINA